MAARCGTPCWATPPASMTGWSWAPAPEMLDLGYQQVGGLPGFLHPKTKRVCAGAHRAQMGPRLYPVSRVHCDPRLPLNRTCCGGPDHQRHGAPTAARSSTLRRPARPGGKNPAARVRRLRGRPAAGTAHRPLCRPLCPSGIHRGPETLALMADIVDQGELAHLPAERVGGTGARPGEANPRCLCRSCKSGALQRLLPELDALFGAADGGTSPGDRHRHPP